LVALPETREFRSALLAWFDIHRRDLPWRRTRDPYAIWVSEIMLQQTRVAAVLDHYASWMQRFPTVETLAAAGEDEVLAAWSGLGYYRRARFLHKGAKAVVAEYGGELPQIASELRELPGIGAYTSAAIASIAFDEAAAVVDGNVERVLLRQTGNGEAGADGNRRRRDEPAPLNAAGIQALASALIDPGRPGDFNQAMMELGATVCLPRNPLCLQCPVQSSCRTRGEHPTAARKAAVRVDVSCGLLRRERDGGAEVLLRQRDSISTVMPGMWELPSIDTHGNAGKPLVVVRHAIMQTNYRVSVMEILEDTLLLPGEGLRRWIGAAELRSLPLTGLARKILLRLGLMVRR
jgi:A/G-specific adenine glycosylase